MWRITQPAMCSGCSSQREESTDVWRSGDFVIVTLQDWCAETGDYNILINNINYALVQIAIVIILYCCRCSPV